MLEAMCYNRRRIDRTGDIMAGLFMLPLMPDEEGAVWLDAQSPATVFTEKTPPHRVALKTTLANALAQPAEFAAWLRVDRLEAYNLLDKLRHTLNDTTNAGAEGVTSNLEFDLVLNGAAEKATGRLVIYAKAKDGRTYRLLFAPDQSGLLSEMLGLAAAESVKITDGNIQAAGPAIVKTEIFPREPELIRRAADPISGREILTFRLSNGLEFPFLLTEGQSEMLRNAPLPEPSITPTTRPN
jgi:hypothetical protein